MVPEWCHLIKVRSQTDDFHVFALRMVEESEAGGKFSNFHSSDVTTHNTKANQILQ